MVAIKNIAVMALGYIGAFGALLPKRTALVAREAEAALGPSMTRITITGSMATYTDGPVFTRITMDEAISTATSNAISTLYRSEVGHNDHTTIWTTIKPTGTTYSTSTRTNRAYSASYLHSNDPIHTTPSTSCISSTSSSSSSAVPPYIPDQDLPIPTKRPTISKPTSVPAEPAPSDDTNLAENHPDQQQVTQPQDVDVESGSGPEQVTRPDQQELVQPENDVVTGEPGVDEPVSGEGPSVDEVKEQEAEVKETEGTGPETKGPEVKKPEVKKPEVKEPEVKEPEVKEPEITKPETKEPEVKDPEVKDPKVEQPETKDPQVEVTTPEVPPIVPPVVPPPAPPVAPVPTQVVKDLGNEVFNLIKHIINLRHNNDHSKNNQEIKKAEKKLQEAKEKLRKAKAEHEAAKKHDKQDKKEKAEEEKQQKELKHVEQEAKQAKEDEAAKKLREAKAGLKPVNQGNKDKQPEAKHEFQTKTLKQVPKVTDFKGTPTGAGQTATSTSGKHRTTTPTPTTLKTTTKSKSSRTSSTTSPTPTVNHKKGQAEITFHGDKNHKFQLYGKGWAKSKHAGSKLLDKMQSCNLKIKNWDFKTADQDKQLRKSDWTFKVTGELLSKTAEQVQCLNKVIHEADGPKNLIDAGSGIDTPKNAAKANGKSDNTAQQAQIEFSGKKFTFFGKGFAKDEKAGKQLQKNMAKCSKVKDWKFYTQKEGKNMKLKEQGWDFYAEGSVKKVKRDCLNKAILGQGGPQDAIADN